MLPWVKEWRRRGGMPLWWSLRLVRSADPHPVCGGPMRKHRASGSSRRPRLRSRSHLFLAAWSGGERGLRPFSVSALAAAPSFLSVQKRSCASGSRAGGTGSPAPPPEDGPEIEILPSLDSDLGTGDCARLTGDRSFGSAGHRAGHGGGDDAASDSAAATAAGEREVVRTLDTYARASITNFTARMIADAGRVGVGGGKTAQDRAAYEVVVRAVEGSGECPRQYYARQRLPLPAEYGERLAEGFGETEKEAEAAAAMHAVRIVDALGFPLFLLSSKQKRHAEEARAAGRHAPLPGDPPMPASTPSPRPIVYQKEGTIATMERQLRVDQVAFAAVTTGAFTPFQHTLASPYFLDPASGRRMRQFFEAYQESVERSVKVIALHKDQSHGMASPRGGGGASRRGGHRKKEPSSPSASGETMFLAQLRLPVLARFGERVCMGKAPTRKDAITLACMHAELTIDALGLALYPTDGAQQMKHVEECRKVGRWCAAPGEVDYQFDTPSPPPLQLVAAAATSSSTGSAAGSRASSSFVASHPVSGAVPGDGGGRGSAVSSTGAATAEVRRGAATVESTLVQHSRAVAEAHQFVAVERLDPVARDIIAHYLRHCTETAAGATAGAQPPFLTEVLGIKFHETYRATLTVPLAPEQGRRHGGAGDGRNDAEEASFVAMGVSSESAGEAELAAATHAIRALAAMNRTIAFDAEARGLLNGFIHGAVDAAQGMQGYDPVSQPVLSLSSLVNAPASVAALLSPVRCVTATHLGRILSPGLAGNKERRAWRPGGGQAPAAEVVVKAAPCPTGNRRPVRFDAESLLNDLLQSQKKLPERDWSLCEDAGGRILVAPEVSAAGGRNYVHTLPAVRTPDVFAVNRLRDYVERHGKQLAACLKHTTHDVAAEDDILNGGQGELTGGHRAEPQRQLHVVKCVLPTRVRSEAATPDIGVSDRGGGGWTAQQAASTAAARIVAHGEAYTEDEAVLMCAMHAELLLDALGIVMYDHTDLQRRHADTARMLGRWAPAAAGALPPARLACVPPPVRKAHADSRVWAQYKLAAEGGPRSPPAVNSPASTGAAAAPLERAGTTASTSTAAEHASEQRPPAPTSGSGSHTNIAPPDGSTAAAPHTTPRASSTSNGSPVTDDELCDLASLQAIHHSEIFRMGTRHMQVYFRSRGSDFFRSVRQYTTPSAQHGNIHRAIVEIPLPEAFGRRFGVGCASSKRRALGLCATHAAWTLDALGVAVYTGKRQAEYAKAAEMRGRSAPRPGDGMKSPSTPSPRGLCCFEGGTTERPEPPSTPSVESLQEDRRVWPVYVRACRTYIEKVREIDRHESLFELGQAPRGGCEEEDEALDMVEQAPLNTHAKRALAAVCARAALPAPLLPFRYEVCGRPPLRRFLVETPVLGTPYTARGLGKSPSEVLARTAMHYEYLVTQIVPRNSAGGGAAGGMGGEGATKTASASARFFDGARAEVTPAGRWAGIALFAVSRAPFQLPVVRAGSGSAPSAERAATAAATRVVTMQLADEAGASLHVRSRPCDSDEDAVEDATAKMFAALQGRPAFQATVHFLKHRPALRAVTIPPGDLLPPQLGAPLPHSRSNGNSTVVGPRGGAAGELPRVPIRRVAKSADATAATATTAFMSTHMAELLLEAAAQQQQHQHQGAASRSGAALRGGAGAAGGHFGPELAMPAAAEDALRRMGLLRRVPQVQGSSGGVAAGDGPRSSLQVTDIGVAVAFLMQCVPPRTAALTVGAAHPTPPLRFLVGPLLPLQLGKLLLAGMLLGCVGPAVRLAALVAAGIPAAHLPQRQSGPENDGLDQWLTPDIVKEALSSCPQRGDSAVGLVEAEMRERLSQLATAVAGAESGRTSPLGHLLRSTVPGGGVAQGLRGAAADSHAALLKLCILFATFPEVWREALPRRHLHSTRGPTTDAASPNTAISSGAAVMESNDGLRTLLLPLRAPSTVPELFFAAFDCGLVGLDDVVAPAAGESADPRRGAKTLQQHHGHMWGFGAPVNICASLIAAVRDANESAVLCTDDDADRVVVLYDGTIALPLRSSACVQQLLALTNMLASELEALRPIPAGTPGGDSLLHIVERPLYSPQQDPVYTAGSSPEQKPFTLSTYLSHCTGV